jgi:phosphoribosylanthranilate isomerase
MARIRLKLCGVVSQDEARLAIATGADAIGLDPRADCLDMTPDENVAAIALTTPPPVAAVLVTRALTAGTIAQQVDAAAVGVVQIARSLDKSEYPGLKRILRGRKILQAVSLARADAFEQAQAYAALADALLLEMQGEETLALASRIAASAPVPVFLGGQLDAGQIGAALAIVRPFGIDLRLPRDAAGKPDRPALARLAEVLHATGPA